MPLPFTIPGAGKCECGLDLAKMRVLKIEGAKHISADAMTRHALASSTHRIRRSAAAAHQ